MFARLPNFRKLVLRVYEKLDPVVYSAILADSSSDHNSENLELSNLQTAQEAEVKRFKNEEYDVVLGMLERRLEGEANAQSPVRQKIGEILRSCPPDPATEMGKLRGSDKPKPAPIHRALIRLSDRGGALAIITTNFDLLFEDAARSIKQSVQTYTLGGIPRPSLRPEFGGVLHIHGGLDRNPERMSDLIVSDHDFGEFYLRRRVVPDLIYDAARLYHLVLVGYSANDPPMKYLLNAIAADRPHFPDLKERFIFLGMRNDDPVELEDWKARGITPVPYKVENDVHSQLENTLGRWAELFAISASRRRIESELRQIVKAKRAGARDERSDLFDHLVRRGDANERNRLSKLASQHNADLGWLDAILNVSVEDRGQ